MLVRERVENCFRPQWVRARATADGVFDCDFGFDSQEWSCSYAHWSCVYVEGSLHECRHNFTLGAQDLTTRAWGDEVPDAINGKHHWSGSTRDERRRQVDAILQARSESDPTRVSHIRRML